jgi:hypothetical protein
VTSPDCLARTHPRTVTSRFSRQREQAAEIPNLAHLNAIAEKINRNGTPSPTTNGDGGSPNANIRQSDSRRFHDQRAVH